jgi:hypothetical protein
VSIAKELFIIHRLCTQCKQRKGILGSKTYPRFVCADCVKRKEAKKNVN